MKKIIKNYENYEIYDTGDVVNIVTNKKLNGSIRLNGYKEYRLSKDNRKVGFYAHRLVAEAFIPNPDSLPIVNHIDGNKLNNNISNLEWVSYSENTQHAYNINLIKSRRKPEFFIENLPNEEWKKVFNYPNYSVSSFGRVRNDTSQRLLKPSLACGYYKVVLSNQNGKKDITIHKLVYLNFIKDTIPKNYKIDHINGNKLNNNKDNLRLVSNSENALVALYETHTNSSTKPVGQYDKDTQVLLKTFRSIREAAEILNLDSSTISKVCRGINKTHGGYIFKYLISEKI